MTNDKLVTKNIGTKIFSFKFLPEDHEHEILKCQECDKKKLKNNHSSHFNLMNQLLLHTLA